MENTDSKITIEYSKQVTAIVLKGKVQKGKLNFYFALKALMQSIYYFNGRIKSKGLNHRGNECYFRRSTHRAARNTAHLRLEVTCSSEHPTEHPNTQILSCNQHDNYCVEGQWEGYERHS
jgi:hypothetical protein